ncbi:MAG: class I SAM-dependent methyltransferase [Planctomycetota bacterium]|nr:class I SAM-dependent methyltransferase [Planctomycetota bacterium]
MPDADSIYDMPVLYDVLHTPGTSKEVTGLEKIAKRFCQLPARSDPRRGRAPVWLEPACGTARYLRVAARRGYQVRGVDLSEPMLAYAADRFKALGVARRARFIPGDITRLDELLPPHSVDFAFNMINSIRHLRSDRDMISHLNAMARVLRPGGVYVVGLSLSCYGFEAPTEDIWRGVRGRCRVTQTIQYIPATARQGTSGRFEQVISHLHVETPARDSHVTTTYSLLSFDLEQWSRTIDRTQMTLEAVVDEHGRDTPPAEPGYAIYVLRPRTLT